MNIYEAIKTRKSVRSYLEQKVEKEKLDRILNAARLAPSARNEQEWRFVIVTDRDDRNKLAAAANNQMFVAEAPVVIACCAETNKRTMRCGLESFPIDVAIAIDHITLAAVAEGLGTCWIGSFDPEAVKSILGIPKEIVVVELLTIGYPVDSKAIQKNRLPLEDTVHREKW